MTQGEEKGWEDEIGEKKYLKEGRDKGREESTGKKGHKKLH